MVMVYNRMIAFAWELDEHCYRYAEHPGALKGSYRNPLVKLSPHVSGNLVSDWEPVVGRATGGGSQHRSPDATTPPVPRVSTG